MYFLYQYSFLVYSIILLLINSSILINAKRNDEYLQKLTLESKWEDNQLFIANKSSNYIDNTAKSNVKKILLIGDSLEMETTMSLCTIKKDAKHTVESYYKGDSNCYKHTEKNKNFHAESPICMYNNYHIQTMLFIGVLRDDLCILKRLNDSKPEREASQYIPDLVVLKAFNWDLQYICRNVLCKNTSSILYEPYITDYYKRLSTLVIQIKLCFPHSQLVLKTDPMWSSDRVRFGDHNDVCKVAVRLYNMVRLVGIQYNIPIFDYYRIFEQLETDVYLRDDIHLKPYYAYIVLNTLFGYII